VGVASLKIEGRLKSPEYVANITRLYREAIDQIAASAPSSGPDRNAYPYEMEMAFSRGLHTGWLEGIDNQSLVHARFGKKRGVLLGTVRRVKGPSVILSLVAPVKPGDGVVFDAGHPEQEEEGGRIFAVHPLPPPDAAWPCDVTLEFGAGHIDVSRVHSGDRVWKTSDPELNKRLRQTYAGDAPRFQRPVDATVEGAAGQPLTLRLQDEFGLTATAQSSLPLATATNHPITEARLREQLGRMGGTPFFLRRLDVALRGEVMLPVSELNRLRREAVSQLEAGRARPSAWILRETPETPAGRMQRSRDAETAPRLLVLARRMEQLETAAACGIATLYAEFEDPKRYRDAAALARGAAQEIWVAPPRITKPGEGWILDQVRSCGATGYLARNFDHLVHFRDARCGGDFSLNVANHLTAAWLMEGYGLEAVTASYDLNMGQLEALLKATPPSWLEVTLHQHMPMFHMEHCVFCAFLSKGKDYRDCGRPCDRHEVRLKDRVGAEHTLKADAGCRNTLFNSRAQTGAEHVPRLLELGLRRFRIELLNESAEETRRTIQRYDALLRGQISGRELWRELKLLHRLGVTHF
jgi:putative protease